MLPADKERPTALDTVTQEQSANKAAPQPSSAKEATPLREKSVNLAVLRPELIPAIQLSRRQRKEALLTAFAHIETLVANTSNPEKLEALRQIINNLIRPDRSFPTNKFHHLNLTEDEAQFPRAREVAVWKVQLLKSVHLERLVAWLDTKQDLSLAEVEELLNGIVYVGMDVNSFVNINGQWQQRHKLRRSAKETSSKEDKESILSEMEYSQIRHSLLTIFCHPAGGRVRIVWDLATVIANHRWHSFTDLIELVADPLPVELLDLYLDDAVKSGLILRSNLCIGALEAFVASGKIQSIAILTQELAKQGYHMEDLREKPTPELIEAIMVSVISNMPIYRP